MWRPCGTRGPARPCQGQDVRRLPHFVDLSGDLAKAGGLIVNTSESLEAFTVEALQVRDHDQGKIRVTAGGGPVGEFYVLFDVFIESCPPRLSASSDCSLTWVVQYCRDKKPVVAAAKSERPARVPGAWDLPSRQTRSERSRWPREEIGGLPLGGPPALWEHLRPGELPA
ncbi:hypothetical protein CDL15_Pgr021634 [Punica granatum]|uniref:Uncharacterized protein n=1 Tax=Punica granatum TaxID=22663 RepID=A0A218WSY8_PUNGR|nr:hypothetical protein CDL15_Pgr021634 [Punica granatum]